MSHPTWARGLKRHNVRNIEFILIVILKKNSQPERGYITRIFVFKSFKTFGSDVSRARFLFTNPFKTIYII